MTVVLNRGHTSPEGVNKFPGRPESLRAPQQGSF